MDAKKDSTASRARAPLTITLPAYAFTEITEALVAYIDALRWEHFEAIEQFSWPFMVSTEAAAALSQRAEVFAAWCAALEEPINQYARLGKDQEGADDA